MKPEREKECKYCGALQEFDICHECLRSSKYDTAVLPCNNGYRAIKIPVGYQDNPQNYEEEY